MDNYPTDLYSTCPCYACQSPSWKAGPSGFAFPLMCLCPKCGNKRCPASSDHTRWQCSGSNDVNQAGQPL